MTDRFVPIFAVLCLAACGTVSDQAPPTVPPPPPCPVVSSSGWRAWVDGLPGPGQRPALIVTGRVALPYPGWQPQWGKARVLETYPVQLQVDLDFHYAGEGATQPPEQQEVRGSWPSDRKIGSVTVSCRHTVLTRLAPVETAQ